MAIKNQKIERRLKIKKRIRKTIYGTAVIPRISIYKSNKCIYVQLVDDTMGHTLLANSSKILQVQSVDVAKAKKIGEDIAEKALKQGIKQAVFDRSGYLYHGKIKALAEGVRAKGLQI